MPVRKDSAPLGLCAKVNINVAHRTDKLTGIAHNRVMSRLPNQISSERADLMVQIERCRRLAREVQDQVTLERLLALAAESEQKLNGRTPPEKSGLSSGPD